MSRKVYVKVEVKLIVEVDEGTEIWLEFESAMLC